MVNKKPDFITGVKLAQICLFVVFGLSCQGRAVLLASSGSSSRNLQLMGYTIQTGAFSVLENAVRMTDELNEQGYDAFYFRHESGLFKVRLGDYSTYGEAREAVRLLLRDKIIFDYFIVPPVDRAKAEGRPAAANTLRDHLVSTAKRYLNYPYTWGGVAPEEGFDCSGLVLAVYRLNGFNLPRTSWEQFKTGNPVPFDRIKKGDLVFFKTVPGAEVSHVGIYAGNDLFIHASSKNRIIRYDSLSNSFYSRCYVGACTYF